MGKLTTPVDNLTGMPLTIYPFGEINEHGWPLFSRLEDFEDCELIDEPDDIEVSTDDDENWHHAFHPKDQLRSNKKGALFLRHSRIQHVPVGLHKNYHHLYEGPPISENIQKRFLMGVFAVAGYMPKVALDVSKPDVPGEIIQLTFNEYKRMIQPDMLRGQFAEKKSKLRQASQFMMGVILKQDIRTINELALEEFLLSPDRDRRLELASFIIDQLVDKSTEPIRDKYQKARKKKRVINRSLSTPRDVVLNVTRPFIPENITKLERKLSEDLAA